ncbi:TldD/PmbA family protein [Leptolyngbya sp. FACHB-261]|uniref:TldD/PmbA family protein n=1 Tax=Leptolyngbya sp. FACHB-261 TaxID=2692806 RepID=UPI0016858533|nr:TldD/PmbA family protein [Leptolyngbya sp. FACHB-261]MBD2103131.1 TldD/PmbA family protein [Leptolyngbya sp. FACHB-261]
MVIAIDSAQSLPTEDQALSLIEAVIAQSQAEAVVVKLTGGDSALSRFSSNQMTQNISETKLTLSVTSLFGHRSATASTTDLDPDTLRATLRRSEELAQVAPEDPEFVPLLEPQTYNAAVPAFDAATASSSPLVRGEWVQQVTALSNQAGVDGSGTLSTEARLRAIGNSRGLRACDRTTLAEFSFTARTATGSGSSWGTRTAFALDQLPITELTEQLIERSLQSRQPRELSPGQYPVILDPAAFSSLLPWVAWNLDGRAADEGRSFMSRTDDQGKPVGSRVREPLFSPLVQVYRDPAHPLLQLGHFFLQDDGLKADRLAFIEAGVPVTLAYSRYWAQQQGVEATGPLAPLVMTGSDQSLNDLIAQTERAILISRAWYVRYVNPRTLVVTGMTRDGTFWIENGKIVYPIKNLRFNQSLPEMLQAVDAVSQAQRFDNNVVPGVRVKAFNFTSITDSI